MKTHRFFFFFHFLSQGQSLSLEESLLSVVARATAQKRRSQERDGLGTGWKKRLGTQESTVVKHGETSDNKSHQDHQGGCEKDMLQIQHLKMS